MVLLWLYTTGRIISIITGVIALVSIILGRQALSRSRRGSGSSRALVALIAGLVSMVLSVVHLATSTGGFGTGSGKLGAIVAMILGLTGTVISAMAISRAGRITKEHR